jgi:hypothetical protein
MFFIQAAIKSVAFSLDETYTDRLVALFGVTWSARRILHGR